MTDQNRGAYTPQTDAPLSFDARRAGGGRGPMPITLIFSALILLALVIGGAVAILYHKGSRKPGEAPQPVGEAIGTTRGAPEASGNAAISPPQIVEGSQGAPPTFTPPPEQPAARPIEAAPLPPPPPPPPAATTTPAAPAPAAKVEPAPAAPKSVNDLLKAAPKAPSPVAKAPAPPPAAKTVAAPAAKAAAPAAGGMTVQIGAFSTTAQADAGWNEVAKLMPGEMVGRTKVIEKLDRDGKTLYRTKIGGFSSRAEAERLCLALLSKGRDCKVG